MIVDGRFVSPCSQNTQRIDPPFPSDLSKTAADILAEVSGLPVSNGARGPVNDRTVAASSVAQRAPIPFPQSTLPVSRNSNARIEYKHPIDVVGDLGSSSLAPQPPSHLSRPPSTRVPASTTHSSLSGKRPAAPSRMEAAKSSSIDAPLESPISIVESSLSNGAPSESPSSSVEVMSPVDQPPAFISIDSIDVPPSADAPFEIGPNGLASTLQNSLLLIPGPPSVQDEELASVSTETEDDPVSRAMRATLDDESEFDATEMERVRQESRDIQWENEIEEANSWPSGPSVAAPPPAEPAKHIQ